jgi:N-acetylglutamate synthase-like GNAT family acetyltransferase
MADHRDDSVTTPPSIERARARDYEAIVELYREAQWLAPDQSGEFWVARRGNSCIAVAHIVDAPAGYAYLDAIVVTQRLRSSGVATHLLTKILPTRRAGWWLECRRELIPFYTPHAFVIASEEQVPDWLRQRVGRRARPITYMQRPSDPP